MSDTQTTVTYTVQNAGITTESWVNCLMEIPSGYTTRWVPAEFESFKVAQLWLDNRECGAAERYRIVQTTTTHTVMATKTHQDKVCQDCGIRSSEVTEDVDPYVLELYSEHVLMTACPDCFGKRADDI